MTKLTPLPATLERLLSTVTISVLLWEISRVEDLAKLESQKWGLREAQGASSICGRLDPQTRISCGQLSKGTTALWRPYDASLLL